MFGQKRSQCPPRGRVASGNLRGRALCDYPSARRAPFGEEVVIGYLYAKEAELTAVRTMFAGRAAKLDGEIIRQRLRNTYC